jgi:acyl-CoA thioesterase FadM
VLEPAIRDVEWSPEVSSPLRIHRGHCEAADQWSFTELPRMVAEARESWALDTRDDPRASHGLGAPVRRLIAELTRPLFIYDAATLTTQIDGPGLRYLYRIHGAKHTHATVYEELHEPSGVA